MKKSVYVAIAFLIVSSAGVTKPIWSGENPMMAQAGHMEHKMQGADKPQMEPMGEMKHGMKMEMATEGIFEGVGEIIALVPEKSQIVVDHEEIPGFMDAMTMGYPVKPAQLLQGLQQGDRIRFTIDAKEKTIVNIIWIRQAAQGTQRKDQPHSHPMGGMKMEGKGEHKHHKQMNVPSKMPPRSTLKPAEGASVKIVSPLNDQTVTGSEVEIRFRLIKGKRGNHVHAYVDEMLMGMFSRDEGTLMGEGTLTGIQPGRHALELRVVTGDHKTELDATDRAHFVVK